MMMIMALKLLLFETAFVRHCNCQLIKILVMIVNNLLCTTAIIYKVTFEWYCMYLDKENVIKWNLKNALTYGILADP